MLIPNVLFLIGVRIFTHFYYKIQSSDSIQFQKIHTETYCQKLLLILLFQHLTIVHLYLFMDILGGFKKVNIQFTNTIRSETLTICQGCQGPYCTTNGNWQTIFGNFAHFKVAMIFFRSSYSASASLAMEQKFLRESEDTFS